jgi:hypothetical protein
MELGGNWEQLFGGVLLMHLSPEAADSMEVRINEFLKQSEIRNNGHGSCSFNAIRMFQGGSLRTYEECRPIRHPEPSVL